MGELTKHRKELCNRVTRSRKQAGLNATDEIEVYIDADAETTSQLLRACDDAASRLTRAEIARSQSAVVERVLGQVPRDAAQLVGEPFWRSPEPAEIGDFKFEIVFVRRS